MAQLKAAFNSAEEAFSGINNEPDILDRLRIQALPVMIAVTAVTTAMAETVVATRAAPAVDVSYNPLI